MGLVSMVGLVGLLGLVGLVGLMGLLGLVGLVGPGCQVWLFMGIFWVFSLIQKYFQMEISIRLMIQKN